MVGIEQDPATLADRLLAQTLASGCCVIGSPMTGAWAALSPRPRPARGVG